MALEDASGTWHSSTPQARGSTGRLGYVALVDGTWRHGKPQARGTRRRLRHMALVDALRRPHPSVRIPAAQLLVAALLLAAIQLAALRILVAATPACLQNEQCAPTLRSHLAAQLLCAGALRSSAQKQCSPPPNAALPEKQRSRAVLRSSDHRHRTRHSPPAQKQRTKAALASSAQKQCSPPPNAALPPAGTVCTPLFEMIEISAVQSSALR